MENEFNLPLVEVAKRLDPQERLRRVGLPEGVTPRQANAITQARLQFALSELAEMNVDNVHKWISEVADKNPEMAVRLYLELLEFRMPRMKAVQVVANANLNTDGKKRLQDMSIEELQTIVAEQ